MTSIVVCEVAKTHMHVINLFFSLSNLPTSFKGLEVSKAANCLLQSLEVIPAAYQSEKLGYHAWQCFLKFLSKPAVLLIMNCSGVKCAGNRLIIQIFSGTFETNIFIVIGTIMRLH